MNTTIRNTLAGFVAIGLVGTGAAFKTGTSTASATPMSASIPTDGSIADVAERTFDSVVSIDVKLGTSSGSMSGYDQDDDDGGGQQRGMEAKGSGVIVTANGRILTNAHVVDNAQDITVTLTDGSEYEATVVGKDTKADLAVIQLKGNFPKLKPVTFGDSSQLRLGDVVLAVGDGLGVGKSVSMGIVSAKGRAHLGIEQYEDFIQTDAVVNHGNSGGALIDMKGELVGINTAIASRTGEYSGIGLAIPTNMARPIMDMLVKDGHVTRGYLGVNTVTATPVLAKDNGLGATRGAAIAAVQPDSPAAKAGLVEGDVVTSVDSTDIKDADGLRNTIAMIKPGTVVTLQVAHKQTGQATLKATLGELPEGQPATLRTRRRQQQP
jgi:S1-C subfamily serine protease|nr:trypsin-like peptidase domain-containing protein [Kofleriaceae bacterium]